jgi:aminoglycoside phosphotransferase (APT) family kinase protein
VRRLTPGVVRGRERLEAAWARGPLTVVHGDAHLGNTYRDGERVGLLDWQVVQQAQAMRDVTYFLCNSVPTDLRRAHERALIDRHRTTLGEYGVAPPSADDAWEQHRLHALYAWIAAAFTAGAATLQDDDVVRAGVARTAHAVLDLDAAAALRALD